MSAGSKDIYRETLCNSKNEKTELINPLEQELGVKCMLQNTRNLIGCTLLGMLLAENFKEHLYMSASQHFQHQRVTKSRIIYN